MTEDKMDADGKALPKPVALTSDQVQRIAAGAAAVLPRGTTFPPSWVGKQLMATMIEATTMVQSVG